MKRTSIFIIFSFMIISVYGQKYKSEVSKVRFFSSAPVEDIEAINSASKSVIDLSNGAFAFAVPSNEFQFEKSLMQEHFNENYMESEKFPKSTFTGYIQNWNLFEGNKEVMTTGKLSIHGVTTEVSIPAQLNIQSNELVVDAVFPIALAEYKIKIPKAVFYNIADTVEVTVHFEYKPLNQ